MKRATLILTIIALLIEATLAIPLVGGTIVLVLAYTPLIITFLIYTTNLVLRVKTGLSIASSIVGMIASTLAFIPLLGWFLHVIMTVLLIIDLVKVKFKN